MLYVILGVALVGTLVLWLRDHLHQSKIIETLLEQRRELKRELTQRPLHSQMTALQQRVHDARIEGVKEGLKQGYTTGFAHGKTAAREATRKAFRELDKTL
jgi:flagellar biosynthesis/type III secretory pathway protein FliH